MSNKKEISKKLNKIIIFASLIYTFIFFILKWSLVIKGAFLNTKMLTNGINVFPILYLFFYITSGIQILLIGFSLKLFYRKNYEYFLSIINLKNMKGMILIIIFTFIWLILNLKLWDYLDKALKLG
ncbi:hypothetical protein HYY70_04950 [Candidatus Woesearchaeota archaeon]|nr:hypothetical protein [Candidatus Woesearchaeota archaeon]